MTRGLVDTERLGAWLTARSLAPGLPKPVPELGGFRVDTNSDKEIRRWVFAAPEDGLCRDLTGLGKTNLIVPKPGPP